MAAFSAADLPDLSGRTVIVTDHAMSASTTGPLLQVLDADPPARDHASKH